MNIYLSTYIYLFFSLYHLSFSCPHSVCSIISLYLDVSFLCVSIYQIKDLDRCCTEKKNQKKKLYSYKPFPKKNKMLVLFNYSLGIDVHFFFLYACFCCSEIHISLCVCACLFLLLKKNKTFLCFGLIELKRKKKIKYNISIQERKLVD